MKKLNLPCQFNGQTQDVGFYVGNPKVDNHPIQNQSHWLSSERGGTVSPNVMDSFSRIHELSLQNKVPFEDLCEFAINSANTEEEETDLTDELLENKDKIIDEQLSKEKAILENHE